jgi:hypothetical protein
MVEEKVVMNHDFLRDTKLKNLSAANVLAAGTASHSDAVGKFG